MGMKFCTSFSRTRASCPFINQGGRYFRHRSFYLIRVLSIQFFIPPHIFNSGSSVINLRFVCATYRSLYLFSSQSYMTLSDQLFLQSQETSPSSLVLLKSYLLQSYKTLIFANAVLTTLVLSVGIHKGLNVTHLIHLVSTNKRFHEMINSGLVVQINAIQFHAQTKMAALCLTSFSLYRLARILDLGYINLLATLGSIGVKVVVLIQ